jgi:putative transposase
VIEILTKEHEIAITRACNIAKLPRTTFYKKPVDWLARDKPIIEALAEIVELERWGFWKCYDRLRLMNYPWNHKRVYRVYCAMKLNMPRKIKKRVPKRERQSMIVLPYLNAVWAIDFMHDALYCGRSIRTFNVLDESNREALGIDVATSIPSIRVTRFLDRLIEIYGVPAALRCDNDPEFIAQQFVDWCKDKGIQILFIQPGKPDQNAFIERFNRTYRNGVLDAYLFDSISEVQQITDDWIKRYNEQRPHDSLGKLPPAMYRQQLLAKEKNSTLEMST